MKKTSVYLEPELDRALQRLAAARGITKAEAIRQALTAAVGEAAQPRITAVGVGAGPGDVADEHDRHLGDSGFGAA